MTTPTRRVSAIFLVLAAIAWSTAHAADDASTSADGSTSDAARKVLSEAADVLAGTNSFRLESTVAYVGKYSDSEESVTTNYELAVNRAGDIGVHVSNSELDTYLYSSGDSFIQYMPEFKQYMVMPRDGSIPQVLNRASFEIIDPVVQVFAALAQFKSPTEGYVVRDLALLDPETIDGRACDHVHFSVNGLGYDLWIEKAPARLVRRIVPNMAQLEAEYEKTYRMDFDITVAADLPTWELGADVTNAVNFTPPAGVEEVERFGPKAPSEEMVGSAAPDFTLPLLDGGNFTLSKERGNIVLLDFFATWCGPCRIGMPVLSEVSKEFADQGVKLISIDLSEDAADVRAFLDETGLDVTVALSTGPDVPDLYKVEPIPQTTIVGRDGVIRLVHVGLWVIPEVDPNASEQEQLAQVHEQLANALREELRELLAQDPAKSSE